MYTYILRRLALGALAVVGVSVVVFVVLRVLPGDPLVAIFGPEGFTKLSEAERARYMADLGLSDPLPVQYFHWVQDIIRGNFGHSFFRAESVADMIARRGPLTAEIALIGYTLLILTRSIVGGFDSVSRDVTEAADGMGYGRRTRLTGVDLLLAEASFRHGEDNPDDLHLTGRQAGEVAARTRVPRLVLTHIPPWYDAAGALAEAAEVYDGDLTAASPGATYDV